jgi:putative transcriptional regulator
MCAIDVRTPLTYKVTYKSKTAVRSSGLPDYSGSAAATTMKNFDDLLASVRQATARAGQPRRAGRPQEINALTVKRLRTWTGLSQPEFARLLGVEIGTLRNWEQGRREPTGPARALLRAISNDPEHVLSALRRSTARRSRALRPPEAAA